MLLSINQLWELTGRDRKTIKKQTPLRSYFEKVGRETRRCFAVTLADRIRFSGSMVLVPGIATTETLSTSPFQFRRYRSELIENIVDKLLSEKFAPCGF